jgi:hypothetical protein
VKLLKVLATVAPLTLCGATAFAQDANPLPGTAPSFQNTFYIGAGKARTDHSFENDDTPFSIGFMHQLSGRKLILGGDISREGTVLDSTWGRDDAAKQATSFNLLVGASVIDQGKFKTDAALLVGIREDTKDCADSYLGYQCYADSEPETDYKGNVGVVLNFSFDRMTVGVRATGESTQILAGVRF